MKPWEETWTVRPFEYELNGEVATEHDEFIVESENVTFAEMSDRAHATLKAAAPDMARVLLAVEWARYNERSAVGECPACHGEEPDDYYPRRLGHAADCALDAALRKAGVR